MCHFTQYICVYGKMKTFYLDIDYFLKYMTIILNTKKGHNNEKKKKEAMS